MCICFNKLLIGYLDDDQDNKIIGSCGIYLDDLSTIQAISDTLPHNLSWVDNILQDTIMNSSQGSGARALNSRTLLGWPHDPSCCNNDHILRAVKHMINSTILFFYE